jgi:hypothetical protein
MKKLLLCLFLATTAAYTGRAETLVALTSGDKLLMFDSATPGSPFATINVTGVTAGESLVAFDYRPVNGGLYALSSAGQLYVIEAATGVAAKVGPINMIPGNDTRFGFDFNPTVDRIRITTDGDHNYRMNPDSAAVLIDNPLVYAAADTNAGANPNVVGSAYTNSFAGALVTVLYDIDSSTDALVIQNPPNNGTLNTVGALGVNTTDNVGFDISQATGVFYASLTVGGTTGLYTINQLNGAATLVGTIAAGSDTVLDIAAPSRTRMLNISTRGRVSPGDDVLIGGFILRGGASSTILIRAIGPSLANAGVPTPLADPVLTIYDRNGVAIAQNDDWQTSSQAAQITALGLAPQNPAESAIYGSVTPGSYTAVVSGKGSATGVALVEIYNLSSN